MAQNNLIPGGLYIMLLLRDDPPTPNNYHWAFYIHSRHERGVDRGIKHHIKGSNENGWFPEHDPISSILKTFLLVGLFQIGTIPQDQTETVNGIMTSFDSTINDSYTTCRIWIFKVLEKFQRSSTSKVSWFECEDLDVLEKEIVDWGNKNALSAAANEQPRPVAMSIFESSHVYDQNITSNY